VCEPSGDTDARGTARDPKGSAASGTASVRPGTRFSKRAPGSFPRARPSTTRPRTDAVTHYFSGVDVPLSREYPEALVDEASLDVERRPALREEARRDILLRADDSASSSADARRSGGSLDPRRRSRTPAPATRCRPASARSARSGSTSRCATAPAAPSTRSAASTRGDEDLHDKVFVARERERPPRHGSARPPARPVRRRRARRPRRAPSGIHRPRETRRHALPRAGASSTSRTASCAACGASARSRRRLVQVPAPGRADLPRGPLRRRRLRPRHGRVPLEPLRARTRSSRRIFPVGALDASRGVYSKGPDAIIDTRSLPPGAPVTFTYALRDPGGRRGPFTCRGAPSLQGVPAVPREGFHRLRARAGRSKGLRPSGPLVTDDMPCEAAGGRRGGARVTAEVP
jgi:hypothetical protein